MRSENKDLELTRKMEQRKRYGGEKRQKNESPREKVKIIELSE